MKHPAPTTPQLIELMMIALQLGELPAHGYVLAINVLHRMDKLKTSQVVLRLEDIKGQAMMADGYSLPCLEEVLYRGAGIQLYPGQVSPYFIGALQQLHRLGLVYSALMESDLNSEESLAGHFTLDPRLREGKSWSENSPIIYRRPTTSLKKVVNHFRRKTKPECKPRTHELFALDMVPLLAMVEGDMQ